MTGPTRKPEGDPGRPRFRAAKAAVLAASACSVFGATALSLTRLLPPPHSRLDYLIIGTTATLGSLTTIFAGLTLGSRRS